LVSSTDGINNVLTFADTQNIGTIYVQINRDLANSVYARFITAASSHNVSIEALSGDPLWAVDAGRPTMQSYLDWITQYQNSASAQAAFSGIHMDIEPYQLDEWSSNRTNVVAGWQKSTQIFTNTARQLKIKSAADLPFWLNTVNTADGSQPLDTWMLSTLDTASFMTYRNTADALSDVATAALKAGQATGKPVRLSAETLRSDEGSYLSFYGTNNTYMQGQLQQVASKAKAYSSYAGMSIHDYQAWSALVSGSS